MDGVNRDQIILDEALAALERTTGAHGRVTAYEQLVPTAKMRADALLEIVLEGKAQAFVAEIKTVDRVHAIGHVKAQLDRMIAEFPDHCPLLVTRYMTTQMAEECRRLKLPYIDTAGNVYLRTTGVLLYVTGQPKPQQRGTIDYRANTQAGLKIIFALLCKPELVGETYREIGAIARAAFGAVGPVLKDLEERAFIRRTKAKGLVLQNTRQLFDEWVTRYPETLRPKLEPRLYQVDRDRLLHADLNTLQAYWGGEMAAELMTHHLQAERLTIYVRGHMREILTKLRMRLDPQGNAELLAAFWAPELDKPGDPIAPAILVYADLMTTGATRNMETAKLIYEQFIEPTLPAE